MDIQQQKFSTEKARIHVLTHRQQLEDGFRRMVPIKKDVKIEELPMEGKNWNAEWLSIDSLKETNKVLYWLHGGAYIIFSTKSHRGLVSRICRAGNLRAFMINYRLAPENPFPAALDDAVEGYRWLIDPKGGNVLPSNIIMGGDSAGGGLTLATCYLLSRQNLPPPAGCLLFSPWLDITQSLESWERHSMYDYIGKTSADLPGFYCGHHKNRRDPLMSPLFATEKDIKALPTTLIQLGGLECLHDEGVQFVDNAKKLGASVSLEVYEDMPHVFQVFSDWQKGMTDRWTSSVTRFVNKVFPNHQSAMTSKL